MQILEGENGKNEDFWGNNRLIDGGKEESIAGRLSRAEDEGGAMRIMATRMSPKCKIKEAHMDVRA